MTNDDTNTDETHSTKRADGGPNVVETPDEDPRMEDDSDGELVGDYRRARIEAKRDPLAGDFQLGDVCIDLSRGRAVQVTGVPDQTVAEWSGDNGYDLIEDNYANRRCRARPNDPVIEAVYVASIQSEPSGPRGSSGPYTFPSSRLARVTIESVEGVRRPYDAVAVDVLRRIYYTAEQLGYDDPHDIVPMDIGGLAFDADVVKEARELADVEQRFGGDDEH